MDVYDRVHLKDEPHPDPYPIAEVYGKYLDAIDGIQDWWVVASCNEIHFFTRIRRDREVERQLHGVQRQMLLLWPSVEFEFTNLREGVRGAAVQPPTRTPPGVFAT